METKPKSREELVRELELLKSKIQTLKQAQVRIEREAIELANSLNGEKQKEEANAQ